MTGLPNGQPDNPGVEPGNEGRGVVTDWFRRRGMDVLIGAMGGIIGAVFIAGMVYATMKGDIAKGVEARAMAEANREEFRETIADLRLARADEFSKLKRSIRDSVKNAVKPLGEKISKAAETNAAQTEAIRNAKEQLQRVETTLRDWRIRETRP